MATVTTAAKAIENFRLNPGIAPLIVQDDPANLSASFDALKPLAAAGKIVSISPSSSRPLTLSHASYKTGPALLALLPVNYLLILTGVPMSGVAAVQSNTHISGFALADTAANIQAAIPALAAATKLTAIAISDSSAMAVSFGQLSAFVALWGKLPASAILNVTGAPAGGAGIAQSNIRVKSFTVSDTAAAVSANFNALLADTKLSLIVLTDRAPLALSATQYAAAAANPGKLPANAQFAISGASARAAIGLQQNTAIVSFTIADSSANIAAALPALAAATKLQSIVLTDSTPIPIAAAQFAMFGTLLSRLPANYTLTLSGATAAGAVLIQANIHIRTFTISDTAANVSANLDKFNTFSKLTAISLTDAGVLSLAAGQYNNLAGVLGKIGGAWMADAAGLTVANAASAQANTHIRRFTVTDTASAIAANIDVLNADTKLTALQISGGTTLTLTAAQLAAAGALLGKIAQTYQIGVTGATIAGLTALHANSHIVSIQIADTAANLSNALAMLAGDPLIASIALTGGTLLTIDESQYFTYEPLLGKLIPADKIAISGVTAGNARLAQAASKVVSFGVVDTAVNIQNNLAALVSAGKLTTLAIAGPSTLTLTYTQFGAGTSLWGKVVGPYTFSVSGVPASAAAALAANSHVAAISVNDTLANIGAKLDQLETLARGGKLTAILVGDPGAHLVLTPAQIAADADAIALMRGDFTIDRTPPPIASTAKINLIWDAQALAAPVAFRNAVSYAAQYIQSLILNPIQINIAVGYGEVAGSSLGNGVLGAAGPTLGVGRTWSQFKSDLTSHIASPTMQSIVSNLPATDPSLGGTIYIASAEQKALGLMNPNSGGTDGTMGFAADPNGTLFAYDPNNRAIAGKYDLIGVVEHEITHALGRIAMGGTYGNWISALDVYRFSAPGIHSPNAGTNAYFSIDNGATNLNPFANSSDLADWSSAAGNDANNAFSRAGVVNAFTQADILQLAALGFATSGTPVTGGTLLNAGSATGGVNASALTFAGAPGLAILDEEAPIFEASLSPASGIEQIAGFEYGIYELRIDLAGAAPSAFAAFDTTVDGQHAIALANAADLKHGLILTGMPAQDTAADLVAHHLHFTDGHAIVA